MAELQRDQLIAIMPRSNPDGWLDPLNVAMTEWAIESPQRMGAFLAQIAYESSDLTDVEENLRYTAKRLRQVWPRRFPNLKVAASYAGNPEKLANRVYAGRLGNGVEASGDGWRYRGRGLIQITFHDNYAAYARALAEPSIVAAPEQVAQPRHAALSACWFWHSKGLHSLADTGNEAGFNQISNKINGGWNGKGDRLENWAEARAVMLA